MQQGDNYCENDQENFFDCVEHFESPLRPTVTCNNESSPLNDSNKSVHPSTFQKDLTTLEKEELLTEVLKLKEEGNKFFKTHMYAEAEKMYSQGLSICPEDFSIHRSILFSNRSASLAHQSKVKEAISDCSEALQLNPSYLKAWVRRAMLYEKCDKLDEAFSDFKKVLELDPANHQAQYAVSRLPDQIEARNEKLKEEMIGTLKDLGNKVLGKFGLSTDNFQLQQNSETGGYNIQFKQNP